MAMVRELPFLLNFIFASVATILFLAYLTGGILGSTWGLEMHILKSLTKNLENFHLMNDLHAYSPDTQLEADLHEVMKPIGISLVIFCMFNLAILLFGIYAYMKSDFRLLRAFSMIFMLMTFMIPPLYHIHEMVSESSFRYLINISIEKFRGVQKDSKHVNFLTAIHVALHCCGLHSYSDFDDSREWNRSLTIRGVKYSNLKAPIFCCKLDYNSKLENSTCPGDFNTENSNWKSGCAWRLRQLHMFRNDSSNVTVVLVFIAQFIFSTIAFALSYEDPVKEVKKKWKRFTIRMLRSKRSNASFSIRSQSF